MRAGGDPVTVGHTEDDALRRFVACRNAGDEAGATRWWSELVELSHDRVVALVDLWSIRVARLDDEEHAEAVQRVLVSLWDSVRWTFEGAHMGQLHRTLERLVHFRCSDVVDEQVRHRRRHAASLDAPLSDEDGDDPGVRREEARAAEDAFVRAGEQADAAELLDRLLRAMDDDRERTVIRRTVEGAPAREIAEELGASVTNVYKIRERGMTSLRAIVREMGHDQP